MRNLIVFIWKHYFFFLFLSLETIYVYLIVQNNYFQRAGFISSSNNLSGSIFQTYNNANQYLHLKETNAQLARENAILLEKTLSSYRITNVAIQKVNDSIYKQKYQYLSAKVVNNSTNRRSNYLTINVGSRQGVEPDMAVISSSGVVGIVKDVSDNFSSVMSLLHKDLKISSKIKKEGSFGPLSWEGENYGYATLNDIPTHVPLIKGDTIVTSAYSSIFPEGILVGIVESFERKEGENFFSVNVQLSTEFKKLDYVYVINNMEKQEQDQLEKQSQND